MYPSRAKDVYHYATMSRRGPFQRSILDQPIANSRLRPQVPRLMRLRLELLADVGHMHAEVMGVFLGLRTPELTEHLAVGHHFAPVDDEEPQHGVFLRRQPHLDSAAAHRTRREVHLDFAELHD